MTVRLHVVLDQVDSPTHDTLRVASIELARALIKTTPRGCEVAALVPDESETLAAEVPRLAEVWSAGTTRSRLLAAWQLGVGRGAGGMIHSPTLAAPLVRHDRVNTGDQTVVTVWDLDAWENDSLAPAQALGLRTLIKRAAKHADAIVVPSHAHAEALARRVRVRGQIQVIAGAAPGGFSRAADAAARCADCDVPEGSVIVVGPDKLEIAFAAVQASDPEASVVVIDARDADAVTELAAAAGIASERLRVFSKLDTAERAAVLACAAVVVAPSERTAFPWRVIEAFALGAPVVAVDSPVHREVVLDGGRVVAAEPDALAGAITEVRSDEERWRVLSHDRGRAFSWRDAAERTWALHAEL